MGHGQHRVSEIKIFFPLKTLLTSVLHVEFKQNNPQTTKSPLNFDLEKVEIRLNSSILLNKLLYFCIFRY